MLEAHRVRKGLDIFVVPRFAQDVLGADPAALQQSLEANYPVRGAHEDIQPDVVQWVDGDNVALKYRGRSLKRAKIWLQRPMEGGYRRYGYTGWQWKVLPATSNVERCAEVLPLADRYDAWVTALGIPCANHYIVTRYVDGQHNIGFHSDKAKDIAPGSLLREIVGTHSASPYTALTFIGLPLVGCPEEPCASAWPTWRNAPCLSPIGSLITVVKMGAHGRPFQVCLPGEEKSPFFSEVLAPGTAVIMTLEANLATKHSVPVHVENKASLSPPAPVGRGWPTLGAACLAPGRHPLALVNAHSGQFCGRTLVGGCFPHRCR